jgi:hypothetical protein
MIRCCQCCQRVYFSRDTPLPRLAAAADAAMFRRAVYFYAIAFLLSIAATPGASLIKRQRRCLLR